MKFDTEKSHFDMSGLSVTFWEIWLKNMIFSVFHEKMTKNYTFLKNQWENLRSSEQWKPLKNRQKPEVSRKPLKSVKMAKNTKNEVFSKTYGD